MSKTKVFLPMFALLLCLGAFLFPVTALAQSSEDTTAPTVTATLSGDTLTVTAKDNASGIAAIYVNQHCFATLVNGTASIQIKEYAGTDKQITVYATDTAGNRSTSVLIDNPYYQAPVSTPAPSTSTPAPSATSTPPASTPSTSTPAPSTSIPPPSASDSGSGNEDTSTEDGTGSAISEGDTVVTPEGTGQVTEIATDEDGKLFYTIQTPAGNVFYLVIDMARTDGNNVYFLNAVTEDDLLALAETDGSTTGGVSAIPDTNPEPTPAPEPTPDPDPETEKEPAEEGGGNTGAIIFVILAVLAVGGAAYYFKILKPRQQATRQDEEEYEDEEFDEGLGDDEEYLFADEPDDYNPEEADTEE
ncbi:DUF4366 domain-containing protein [Christensenellaceae bacterium OttesenSCG-928-K19]|nr:DUF4366 domain-containing protein [Christensenellaceae bacterium OttesenSCG-928-K19]